MMKRFAPDPTNQQGEVVEVSSHVTCFHCGQPCDEVHVFHEKYFCCYGCKTVFEILEENSLCEYYGLGTRSGAPIIPADEGVFGFLDEPRIRKKIVTFDSDHFARALFYTPAVHCVSCIWLLENLQKIENGILRSEVNFAHKTVTIDFNPSSIKLGRVAGLLQSLGYTPKITLDSNVSPKASIDRSLIFKLSIAGFCFGNVMLFSFPEYLGMDHTDQSLKQTFSWLNVALALPVFFYSASGYFKSASKSFTQKQINIDVPIAAGLLALFIRSVYDILTTTGPGYLDSFTGLVFFLLIGRWFQSKTYENLAFDRDFKSYFPLAVQKLVDKAWKPVVVYELEPGDTIRVRNMEVIPADCTLLVGQACIDYSFVTGESKPVTARQGNSIYAGGRLIGTPATFRVDKKTSQSQLTGLWNNEAFKKITGNKTQKIIDRAARKFTWIVMGIAVVTAIYWQLTNPSQMWSVLTSVLMVACPCALALAAPFTYGSMLRVFGRNHFYLKNADVIERLGVIDTVVFDKTGTVTYGEHPEVSFVGILTAEELLSVKELTSASTHPLSELISKSILGSAGEKPSSFKEIAGKGIEGVVDGKLVQVGSAEFVGCNATTQQDSTCVYAALNGKVKGYFSIRIAVRRNIGSMLNRLGKKCVALLSGDNESDRRSMSLLFGASVQLLFNQTPHDKLAFIRDLQNDGKKVMMVGDGLNDAGALKQSDVGIAVTDNAGVFTPACDGILQGDKINLLDKFVHLARFSTTILTIGFVISFLYNTIALAFAVTGHLTPLVAAILMPISSISVVAFSSLAVNFVASKKLRS